MLNSSEILEGYLGRPYFLGDIEKGLDCLNFLLNFYESRGYKFPDEYEGITRTGYALSWKKDPDKTRAVLGRFLMGLGDPIDKHFFKKYDLLLFRGKEIPVFAAIANGNGNMSIVWKEGFHPVPFHLFEKMFIGARRLI